jgi:hypothetical protein
LNDALVLRATMVIALLQQAFVARDVVDDLFGDVVVFDCRRWILPVLPDAGRRHSDLEPDPALDIHDAANGSVNKWLFVVGSACIPLARGILLCCSLVDARTLE